MIREQIANYNLEWDLCFAKLLGGFPVFQAGQLPKALVVPTVALLHDKSGLSTRATCAVLSMLMCCHYISLHGKGLRHATGNSRERSFWNLDFKKGTESLHSGQCRATNKPIKQHLDVKGQTFDSWQHVCQQRLYLHTRKKFRTEIKTTTGRPGFLSPAGGCGRLASAGWKVSYTVSTCGAWEANSSANLGFALFIPLSKEPLFGEPKVPNLSPFVASLPLLPTWTHHKQRTSLL